MVFCDDIRHEVGNKKSFIGVYSSALFFDGKFPATLPKLCAAIVYEDHIETKIEKIILRVALPGDDPDHPTFEIDFPVASQIAQMPKETASGEKATLFAGGADLVLTPATINQPGFLRVSAIIEGEEVEFAKLFIGNTPANPEA